MLFSPFPLPPALSLHLIFPARGLRSCICNHVTSLGAAFVSCVCAEHVEVRVLRVVVFARLGGSAGGCEGGLAAHWVSMRAHTTALPVLISFHAGELWHQAGSLLEKQGNIFQQTPPPLHSKYPHTPFTCSQRDTQLMCGLALLSGPVASVYCCFFCVDDAKINFNLENVL